MKATEQERKLKAKKFKKTVNSVLQGDFEFENAEISASEDEGDDTRQHQKLLEAVQKLKGQKPTVIQRSEASQKISEFNLTEVGKEKVKLNELVKTLKQTTNHVSIKQQLKKVSKKKKLPVPLSKPVADKIKRSIVYSKVSQEVTKWDAVVKSNRSAEQIIYPLKQPEYRLETTENFVKRFTTKTPMEETVAKLLSGSEYALDQDKILTPAEERHLKAMSLKEAKERHQELQKIRALLSYKEAKARRQSKIKSKKFHRVLKKDKMKKLIKEFGDLQNGGDPAAAQEMMKMLDKQRILERVTLKHKSTGKWAKYQKLRAKYNVESRESLKEQLELGRELSKKVVLPDKIDDGSNTAVPAKEELQNMRDDDLLNLYVSENDGIKSAALKRIVDMETETKSKIDTTYEAVPTACSKWNIEEVVSASEDEDLIDESLERKKTVEDFEDVSMEEKLPERKKMGKGGKEKLAKGFVTEKTPKIKKPEKPKSIADDFAFAGIVPDKELNSIVPEGITFGDEDLDDVEDPKSVMSMGEAFADESVIDEFREEKNAVRKREQPEGIDLFLPGWGSWGGSGVKLSKRKRQRFFIKAPVVKRRDDTLGNVIINEDKDKKAAVHQVSHLPFPFNSVHQFESIIRQPVGNTWNPETSFQNMIAPRVVTKSGKIIDPIDAEAIVLEKTVNQKPSILLKDRQGKLSKKQGNSKNKQGQKNNKSKLRNKRNKK